jgi:glucose/arabinose dehydrogenase
VPAFPAIQFQRPSSIEELPGEQRLLVTEIGGKIFCFPKEPGASHADLVIDLHELLPRELQKESISLFDAEPHPKFHDNRFVYACYVHPGQGGQTRVSRFTLNAGAKPTINPVTEQLIITWPSGGHNGGCLEFGTDGYLYISTGDGSGPNPPDARTTGQDVSDLFGAILRIDVDHPASTQRYLIPPDNPFVKQSGARPEIWAYGLRNPWKFGVDVESGNIFAADNGWESWEMIHRIVRGGNCGWPVMEGRALLRSEVKVGPTPILPPVKDHPHTEANSVIGGPVYRGSKLKDLVGSFVYGDYITGTIWAIRPDKDNSYSHRTLVDTDQRVIAFTEGSDGELFVLDYDVTGQIYELLPSDAIDNSANFPRRLSETGLFTSLKDLEPAPGVVPYQVIVSRWMDGASGQRWVAIPGAGRIQFPERKGESTTYPDGTVFVKQLSLPQGEQPAIRLETQILHNENGAWHPYSYLWDDAGEDAVLVDSIGANRSIRIADSKAENGFAERTWHVNAANECKLCHNAGPGFVLGFVSNQLNGPISINNDGDPHSQQDILVDQGALADVPLTDNEASALVDPLNPSLDLDARARSYLHVNCSMCHHPGGNAGCENHRL